MRATPLLVQLVLLALWLGGAIVFAAVVAPALFAALPTRTLAGAVVGRVLPWIFYSGIVVGLIVVALELRESRSWRWTGRETAAGAIVATCAIAQFVIGARIEKLRTEIGGVLENLAPDDARRAMFGRLHGASVGMLGVAMIAAAVAGFLAARSLRER
jgi:hypothetical protein